MRYWLDTFLKFFFFTQRFPPFCAHNVLLPPLHKSQQSGRCLVLNSLERTFHIKRSIASPAGRGGGDINYRSDQVDKVASFRKWQLAPLSLCTGNKLVYIKIREPLTKHTWHAQAEHTVLTTCNTCHTTQPLKSALHTYIQDSYRNLEGILLRLNQIKKALINP